MEKLEKKNTARWKRMILFLAIAVTISNIFRFNILEHRLAFQFLPTWLYLITMLLLEGSGVIIAALIAIFLLRKERGTEISLFGTSKSKSLQMMIVPMVILTVIGVKNEYEMNAHFYALIASVATFVYCVMEEYGWRTYLQEELRDLEHWRKYLTIGFLWYFWHLTFLTDATIADNLFFLGMMIFGSWGIGQIVESTKSIIAGSCFHLIIQIMMFNALIKNGLDGTEKLITLGVSITLWALLMKKWEKENTPNLVD